ncbi:sigma-70 family RNA polymerase sigma factor [Pseudonocardia abyssalis]|uniref:Sigma-70 family RNA polymerase sigma factor n=1 Tax=Pseudonocardia abyssalis TaxID=2792008 RepID=A0ABS6UWC3_9PSEU|nr:sigma-70 family RNA polymerase sigma factor [Pseudonocardia abyssalis]MBW0115979.1 sigma-70 family RNA polymerase sigma factor [Pseudonocardia abyssalis]MBW0136542.1 sigma-70 family RNA polymerase sigma factor [Pseudonocardia abyssalis]
MQDDDSSGQPGEHNDSDDDPELERLARLAGQGDRGALEEFLCRIKLPVIRYCRSKLLGATGAQGPDDVAQEVLLAVCDALPRFRPDGTSVMAFIFGICRFKIVDAYRASGRDRSTPSDTLPDNADDDPGPEHAAILSTEVVRMIRAMARLPENHREILHLRIGLGYPAEEVARLLGTTAGAVRVTQHRAMVKLRRLLAENLADEEED